MYGHFIKSWPSTVIFASRVKVHPWPGCKGLHWLHTVRFSEVCQNPFVTKVVRTLRGESHVWRARSVWDGFYMLKQQINVALENSWKSVFFGPPKPLIFFLGILYSKFLFLGQGLCLFVFRQRSEICGQFFFSRGAYTANKYGSWKFMKISVFRTPQTPQHALHLISNEQTYQSTDNWLGILNSVEIL